MPKKRTYKKKPKVEQTADGWTINGKLATPEQLAKLGLL